MICNNLFHIYGVFTYILWISCYLLSRYHNYVDFHLPGKIYILIPSEIRSLRELRNKENDRAMVAKEEPYRVYIQSNTKGNKEIGSYQSLSGKEKIWAKGT